MKYTVEWCEVKKTGEKNGRQWKMTSMTLKDEAGVVTDEVTTFDPVMPGITIEGTIELNGQYKNFKSTPVTSKQGGNSAFKGQQIEKAQAKTAEYVAVAQGRKEEGIKMSGAQRDAVLIVTTLLNNKFYTELSVPEIKNVITEWRNWFLSDDFEQHPPF